MELPIEIISTIYSYGKVHRLLVPFVIFLALFIFIGSYITYLRSDSINIFYTIQTICWATADFVRVIYRNPLIDTMLNALVVVIALVGIIIIYLFFPMLSMIDDEKNTKRLTIIAWCAALFMFYIFNPITYQRWGIFH